MAKELLILTLHFTEGGAERVLSELINEWVEMGWKITIVETAPEMYSNSYRVSEDIDYLKFKRQKSGPLNSAKVIHFVIKAMKAHPNATVLAFTKSTMYPLAVASFFTKNRIVVSERNDPYSSPQKRSRRFLRDLLFKRADACIFQTADAMAYFPQVVREKGTVIPNPINRELPLPYTGERLKRIVSVCRLDVQKNVPMAIKAFKRFSSDIPGYTFYIYGRGKLEDELKKLIKEEGLQDKVVLAGFSDNVYQEMNQCAMFVLSSNFEGISNSMLEALALGIPSVVTDCPIGGARMVIENGVNGLLVPVGDVDAMYKSMKYLAENEKEAKIISENAAKVRDLFPVEVIAKKWADLL